MTDLQKIVTRARREAKHARLRLRPVPPAAHPLLHIVGCQRSGTTMLTELLDRDPRIRVFGELGSLFDDRPRHHRLRDIDEVRHQLARSGAALNVVKPLVESHRCGDLLDLQPHALTIWMFRHYRDVAASNLKRFGVTNGVDNLRPIVQGADDWRNEGLTEATRAIVRDLFDEQMPPHDAAALFWYCRNTLWHNQSLDGEPRVRTCRYEQLVADPASMTNSLYRWVGLEPPSRSISEFVHTKSVGKGEEDITADVRTLCDTMWDDLLSIDERTSLGNI